MSGALVIILAVLFCFNPRPPKRTLCLDVAASKTNSKCVSIHVLRRGRCVITETMNPPNKIEFQSTSSEEDVVSSLSGKHTLFV